MEVRFTMAEEHARSSPAHLLLLSKFLTAGMPDWFLEQKMLDVEPLKELLDFKFKARELKDMLRQRRLKITGRKAELIDRLIEGDREGMSRATEEVHLLRCSPGGAPLAQEYAKKEQKKRAVVEDAARSLVELGDYPGAVRAVVAFEKAQIFPRGLGIDWDAYDVEAEVKVLRTIAASVPEILSSIAVGPLRRLRVAAEMMELWGTNSAAQWLPQNFSTGIRLDPDSAARMLLFHGYHRRDMDQYVLGKVRSVEVLSARDDRVCSYCAQISGRRYSIRDVPELPYGRCTGEVGCRCTTIPAEFG